MFYKLQTLPIHFEKYFQISLWPKISILATIHLGTIPNCHRFGMIRVPVSHIYNESSYHFFFFF